MRSAHADVLSDTAAAPASAPAGRMVDTDCETATVASLVPMALVAAATSVATLIPLRSAEMSTTVVAVTVGDDGGGGWRSGGGDDSIGDSVDGGAGRSECVEGGEGMKIDIDAGGPVASASARGGFNAGGGDDNAAVTSSAQGEPPLVPTATPTPAPAHTRMSAEMPVIERHRGLRLVSSYRTMPFLRFSRVTMVAGCLAFGEKVARLRASAMSSVGSVMAAGHWHRERWQIVDVGVGPTPCKRREPRVADL